MNMAKKTNLTKQEFMFLLDKDLLSFYDYITEDKVKEKIWDDLEYIDLESNIIDSLLCDANRNYYISDETYNKIKLYRYNNG